LVPFGVELIAIGKRGI